MIRIALLVALVVWSSVCLSGWSKAARVSPPSQPAEATRSTPIPQACGFVRRSLGCRVIEVEGTQIRYSVQHQSGTKGGRGVLVDLGGPGYALFAADAPRAFTAAWPSDETLVFVEEPWVTQPVSSACDAAMAKFYTSLRSKDGSVDNESLARDCGLGAFDSWGWTPEKYARVVRTIFESEHLDLNGIVGVSFGGPRTEALWGEPSLRWIILNSPAPHAVDGARYLDIRQKGIQEVLARACEGSRSACDAGSLIKRTASALTSKPIRVPTRAILVDEADLEPALMGLTYLPVAERIRIVDRMQKSVIEAARDLGRLSDTTLLRQGEQGMSAAILAYWSGVCPRYAPWPEETSGDNVSAFLQILHHPCRMFPRLEIPAPLSLPAVCIAHGGEDGVTPTDVIEQWKTLLPNSHVVHQAGAPHGDLELALACRRKLSD
jgi:pimeloyl-ACP methyl ester carboxylesterase